MKLKEILLTILLSPLALIGIIIYPFMIIKKAITGEGDGFP